MSDQNIDPKTDPKLANAEAKAAKAKAKALRPWFKKKRFILPIALLLLIGFSQATKGNSGNSGTDTSTSSGASSNTKTDTPSESVGQQNAREKAQEYLDTQAFSRSGLIKQLVFEKFSEADATYGVDALQVDWKEQAAKKAQEYLDIMSYSHGGLVDQLKFEGFSSSEAEYGVTKVGL